MTNLTQYTTLTKTGRNLEMEINRHYRDYTRKDQQADIQARRSVPDESIQIAVAYESYLEPEQELNFEGTNNHNT